MSGSVFADLAEPLRGFPAAVAAKAAFACIGQGFGAPISLRLQMHKGRPSTTRTLRRPQ